MRIGIITFHFVNNFGGALQAYALQRVVREQCHVDTVIVNYKNWFIRFTDFVRIFPISSNVKEICSGLCTMKHRLGRGKKFKRFLKENVKLTRLYRSTNSLKRNTPECEKFVCGSDQIWNPFLTCGVTGAYFCTFVKESSRKISYAASFGTSQLMEAQTKKIGQYVNELGSISVREKDGIDYVRDITGRDAKQLIDPALLLDASEWDEVAKDVPGLPDKYILLYIMQRDESVYNYVHALKKQVNLPIVEISRYGYKPSFVDYSVIDIGPSEFVGLFRNSQYVCSNSYHGLIFSIIFNKELCLIPSKRFSGRINNLLSLLECEIPSSSNEDNSLLSFDNDKLRKVIEREKNISFEYLKKNILG